jgi:hypothetical protein
VHPKEDPSSLRAPTKIKRNTLTKHHPTQRQTHKTQQTTQNQPNNASLQKYLQPKRKAQPQPSIASPTTHNPNKASPIGDMAEDTQHGYLYPSQTLNHSLPVHSHCLKCCLQLRELHRTDRRKSNLVLPPCLHLKTINNSEHLMAPRTIPQPPKIPSLSFSQTTDQKLSLENGQIRSRNRLGPFAKIDETRRLRRRRLRQRQRHR